MSRTHRNIKHVGYLRHPHQSKQARREKATRDEDATYWGVRMIRNGSVPPDAYDDIPVAALCEVRKAVWM